MEIAKDIPELYPDLIEQGSLANALQAALRKIGSSLSISDLQKSVSFIVYARVESGHRFSQIYLGAKTRMFSCDFWNRGVSLAHGATPEIMELARAIDKWIAFGWSTGELASAFHFVQVKPTAATYERGEEVEMRWRQYLASVGERFPELTAFVSAAAAEPKLRQLFPFTSLNRFCFSRCTGYPFTHDTPEVVPLGSDEYEVISSSGESLGRSNAAGAVALAVAALPPDCGPAVPGTADQLSSG
ncbi:MAG TPA: DUF6193 family natural product biosynthesis protein [Pyrinomonadaceae bacterium]|nr:DUF6193 family natural product biosynthesis protein [Pyrinomonadaceae bacterium]